jgi:hypothetical protein
MMKIKYREAISFQKTFKKLLKKYPSLRDDLEVAKINAVELLHIHKIDNQSVFRITGIIPSEMECYIVKKFTCRSLKGSGVKSGIRFTYIYLPNSQEIILIEIYHKNISPVEDKSLIQAYIDEYLVS